ncbi:sensor histidine kinase [Corynebacterium glutamicum]|uniref:sensor histidine kinase n=1 Tax=Corynebacterium glutamicum TaxID=1718 RepID=UPI000941CF12|nr:sensor histidine kinase [Corynebacterium glutamicum]OKX82859.1 histidine kinase [Corynebacterium glutamicum]
MNKDFWTAGWTARWFSRGVSLLASPVTAPLNSWRRLPNLAKYTLYTRVSLQAIPVVLLSAYFLGIVANAGTLNPSFVWLLGFSVILLIVTVLVYEYQPSLNSHPRRSVQPFFFTGLVLNVLGVVVSVVLQLPALNSSESTRATALIFTLTCVFLLSIAYIPWMNYRWVWLIAMSAVLWWTSTTTDYLSALWVVIPPLMAGTVRLSVWTVDVMKEVERSRELEASLRVTEERLRFAQELHDTLGQHLAAMSVKSELALALAKRGDDRLENELRELQKLTRTSMSEMRDVVSGYRTVNLATEIEGAKSLLADAHIHLSVIGTTSQVSPAHRELCAWLVREATTNILRHSDATDVTLTLSSTEVRMDNNGVNKDIGRLSGLSALRTRAESAGMTLIMSREDDQFSVRMLINAPANTPANTPAEKEA